MPSASLRCTLGVLSAVTVAIVAAVTLAIALSSSFEALQRMGLRHAEALLTIAASDTEALFASASDATIGIRDTVVARAWNNPSDDQMAFESLKWAHHGFVLKAAPYLNLVTYFADNSAVNFAMDLTSNPPVMLRNDWIASPYSTTFPNQTIVSLVSAYDLDTHMAVAENVPRANATWRALDLQRTFLIRNTTLWEQLRFATSSGTTPIIYPPASLQSPTGIPDAFILIMAPMHTAAVPPAQRSYTNVYAYAIASLNFDKLALFLQSVKTTPGAVIFAYDGNGYLLSTSEPVNSVRFQLPLSSPAGLNPGCYDTRGTGESAAPGITHVFDCRKHLSAYPD